MKKILTILFTIAIFAAPAQAQLLGELGGAALKAVGAAAGKALINSVANKVEEKAGEIAENSLMKMLGAPSDSTEVGGLESLGNALSSAASGFSTLIEKSKAAGEAPLKDFSEQNAARREHNLTLVYDDWD